MAGIPSPSPSDPDDVVWALQTAAAQWERGEHRDAAVWLQRAARAAGDAGQDDRAFELGRLAADLLDSIPVSTEANGSADKLPPGSDDAMALSSAIAIAVTTEPAGSGADDDVVTSAPPMAVLGRGASRVDDRLKTYQAARSTIGVRDAKPLIDQLEREAEAPRPPRLRRPPPPPPRMRPLSPAAGDPGCDGLEVVLAAREPATNAPPGTTNHADPSHSSELEPEPGSGSEQPASVSLEPTSLEPVPADPTAVVPPPDPMRKTAAGPDLAHAVQTSAPADPRSRETLPSLSGREPSCASVQAAVDVPDRGPADADGPANAADHPGSVPQAPVSISAPRLVVLGGYDAFADMPEDELAALEDHAEVQHLARDEESSGFGLALVVDGEVNVAAIVSDIVATRLGPGSVLRNRGTVRGAVDVRLIGASDKAVVATWSEAVIQDALAALPWVEEELCNRADRVHALVGATLGPVGNELDSGLWGELAPHLQVRVLVDGEPLVVEGDLMPGLVIVGTGTLRVMAQDGTKELVAGDIVFASALLQGGPAPGTVRAGPDGAVLLWVDRNTTQELFMTFPPLLDLLLRD